MAPKKPPLSAIQQIQSSIPQFPIDEMETTDNSDEKKAEILERVSNTIDELLTRIKNKEISLKNYALNEKIELLQKTKMAVQELLVQILSGSCQNVSRSYEALAMIIKVNADIIRNLEEAEGIIGQPSKNQNNQQNNQDDNQNKTQIIIAPSEEMLNKIVEMRHKKEADKDVNVHVNES